MNTLNLSPSADSVFTPYAPISSSDFCYGRKKEIERIRQSILATGKHIILFGERGSGKTSLANISYQAIREVLPLTVVSSHLLNHPDLIWKTVLEKLEVELGHSSGYEKLGLDRNLLQKFISEKKFQLNHLVFLFRQLKFPLIIVMDEVDLLAHEPRNLSSLAETIKMFSDQVPKVTLMLIGIANKASELMAEHVSLERCLIEIKLERMSTDPLMDILEGGLMKLGMNMLDEVKQAIVDFSEGLPFYIHLLAQESILQAQVLKYQTVVLNNYQEALKKIIEDRRSSLKASYRKATSFSKNNLYQNILKVAVSFEENKSPSSDASHSTHLSIPSRKGMEAFSAQEILAKLNLLQSQVKNNELDKKKAAQRTLLRTIQTYLNKACTPAKGEVLKKHYFPEHHFSREVSTKYSFKNPFIKAFIRDIIK